MNDYDDDDYEDNYDDYDDDGDWDDNQESDAFPCPECGTEVYEFADACPNCGHYLVSGWTSRGPWYTFGGAIKEWSPFWLFLAMLGVIATIFFLMV